MQKQFVNSLKCRLNCLQKGFAHQWAEYVRRYLDEGREEVRYVDVPAEIDGGEAQAVVRKGGGDPVEPHDLANNYGKKGKLRFYKMAQLEAPFKNAFKNIFTRVMVDILMSLKSEVNPSCSTSLSLSSCWSMQIWFFFNLYAKCQNAWLMSETLSRSSFDISLLFIFAPLLKIFFTSSERPSERSHLEWSA